MSGGATGAVVRQVERLFRGGTVSGLSEGQLLDRFVSRRDEAAFEALVVRHGPMVLSVCRRLLRDPNDVDDAFQATFLVLVRKAGSLRRRDLLGNWLYGVAYRVSVRSRAIAARRAATETTGVALVAAAPEPADPAPEVHEEVHRLPERYRVVVVLCYLEGLTHEEAAVRIGCPLGTVKGRLSRARDLLRCRLTRRGLTLGTGAAVAGWLTRDARAAVPGSLLEPTVRVAALAAAGQLRTVGLISARALLLSEGVIHTMSLGQWKVVALSIALAGSGAGALAYQGSGPSTADPADAKTPATGSDPRQAAKPPAGARNSVDPFFNDYKQYSRTADSAPRALPPQSSVARDTAVSEADEIKQQRKTNAKGLERMLSEVDHWDAQKLQWLIHWSESSKQAQLSLNQLIPRLRNRPDRQIEPLVSHRDAMKRVYEITRKLADPDGSKLADLAQDSYNQAQRELDRAVRALKSAPDLGPGAAPQSPTADGPGGGPVDPRRADGPAPVRPSPPLVARVPSRPAPALPVAPDGEAAYPLPEPPVAIAPVARGIGGGMAGRGGMRGMGRPSRWNPENPMRVIVAGLAAEVAHNDKSPATAAILRKLDTPIPMSFPHPTPLVDVLKYIRSASQGANDQGIPIYVEPDALNASIRKVAGERGGGHPPGFNPAGFHPDTLDESQRQKYLTVTLDLEGAPLKTSLRLILKQLDLAYCVRDGLLIIS